MIGENGIPETPDWADPSRDLRHLDREAEGLAESWRQMQRGEGVVRIPAPTIPPNIELGAE